MRLFDLTGSVQHLASDQAACARLGTVSDYAIGPEELVAHYHSCKSTKEDKIALADR